MDRSVGGDAFPLVVQDLPAVVEGWKSMDDTNLVKSLDVGQVMVVKPQGTMDLDVPREARDGVGPPVAVSGEGEARDGRSPS